MTTLNRDDKARIIASILGSIPRTDFIGQAKDLARQAIERSLPEKVRKFYRDEETRGYVKLGTYRLEMPSNQFMAPSLSDWMNWLELKRMISIEDASKIEELLSLNTKQLNEIETLKSKMHANFSEIRTLKSFQQRFPELVSFLPARFREVQNLPASTQLMESLKAAGLTIEAQEEV